MVALLRNEWTLAVALLLAAEVELAFLGGLDHRATAVVVAPFITLPLRWRRRAPIVAAATMITAFAVQTATGVDDNGQVVPLVVILLTSFYLGRHTTMRGAVGGAAFVAALGSVAVAVSADDSPSDYVFVVLVVAGAVAAGAAFRLRTDEVASHARRAALAEAISQERAREAIEAERRRIARELHDVVAHAISLMVLQAGAAEAVLERQPDQARASLCTIQDQGRAALVDMRHLLGILRRSPDGDDIDPSPSVRDLPALVEQFRAAGLPVELDLDAALDDAPIPSSVEVSVHRVVREALTNVLRHAGPATAHVGVGVRAGAIELEVRDDGQLVAAPGFGSGYGLVGMRERVALFGGELHAGPGPDGGFVVRARLPLDAMTVAP